MPIVPKNPADQITFYSVHVPVWAGDPVAIGLTAGITADLQARLTAAEAAREEALALRQRARAATLAYRQAVSALQSRGGRAIAAIKSFAEVNDDPAVYARARIPAPRGKGSPIRVPGAPEITSATVDSQGVLTLVWKPESGASVGPSSGNFFEVLRRRAGMGEERPVVIGAEAGLSLRDPDIGPGENIYTVRARRGASVGIESVAVSVDLPGGGGGTSRGEERGTDAPAALRRAA